MIKNKKKTGNIVEHLKENYLKYLAIIIIVISLAYLGYFIYSEHNTKDEISSPTEEIVIEEDSDDDKKEEEPPEEIYNNELPGYRESYNNPNIFGKLEIPNLEINSLIVRASNNSYYLNYNLYNEYDALGVPFFDYRNTDLVNNKQINIYGHNTRNEKYYDRLPFVKLDSYANQDTFNNYRDIYLSIDEEKIHYEVIAVKIITAQDNEHMKIIFYSDEDFLNHAKKLLSNTLYKIDNLTIKVSDQLIVLQVCHYNPDNSYLLVIGKKQQ